MTRRMAQRLLACAFVMLLSATVHGQTVFDGVPSGDEATTAKPDSSSATTAASARVPIPGSEVARNSLERVHEIFSSEFASANTAPKKAELAKRLVNQVSATTELADRWILLSEALRLAIEGGDASTAVPLIERISREFAVDHNACRLVCGVLGRVVARVEIGPK